VNWGIMFTWNLKGVLMTHSVIVGSFLHFWWAWGSFLIIGVWVITWLDYDLGVEFPFHSLQFLFFFHAFHSWNDIS
jgi:hypothetical protein